MIASLNGKLIYKDAGSAVVECGGVGLRCYIAQTTSVVLPQIGENVFLYTFLSVKEDALDLYGFAEEGELQAFKLITSVNGVGPKIALAMLSQFTADKLYILIGSSDAKALTAASGVGIKLAQRIVLELKDKVSLYASDNSAESVAIASAATDNLNSKEAIAALVSLGYSQSEASLTVGGLDLNLPTEELIKLALKSLARRF